MAYITKVLETRFGPIKVLSISGMSAANEGPIAL